MVIIYISYNILVMEFDTAQVMLTKYTYVTVLNYYCNKLFK